MTDRELLEAAARAVGYRVVCEACEICAGVYGVMLEGIEKAWSPLTDDGDALRLAVKLGLRLDVDYGVKETLYLAPTWQRGAVEHGDDPYAATRRAIVRAAAQIGAGMIQGSTAVHP